jgi:protein involved in polysaccharide export with SLBB domain
LEVSRVLSHDEASELGESLLHTFHFALDRNLKMSEEGAGFALKAFDKVYVRRVPGYRPLRVVNVRGEVKYAGDYSIVNKDEKISDLIARSGGLSPSAYIKGASLRREFVLSDAEYEAKVALVAQDENMSSTVLARVKHQIVGVDLEQIMANPGCAEDLQLSGGDQLLIPSILETVVVSGSVLRPVAHTFIKDRKLKGYIERSGGFSLRAQKKKVYVLYANGTTQATRKGLFGRRFPKIKPGCEIIVPDKPKRDRSADAGKWLGISTVLVGMFTALSIALK